MFLRCSRTPVSHPGRAFPTGFCVCTVMTLKLTSGLMQSILLFAQIITFINRTLSFITLSDTSLYFSRIHSFLLGFLSLRFFYIDKLSFCLWKGATVLHNLTFNYITSLSALLLLGLYIYIAFNKVSFKTSEKTKACFGKLTKFVEEKNLFKNSTVHSISTFLLLSYIQYTVTSFQILSRLSLYGEGNSELRSVVRLQGNVGPEHLPYAIPALLVLIFLSLPPPLLLISYPLGHYYGRSRQN